ncbi:pre-mRNA splicing factor cef-1 [Delphinella strobiligena]|nr:pre-mRNA splicing factor cef-1 [Delphinella strobiligena]
MPVVKGGVWTNIEDEILKAAVSKYGLNQWARVSSLLARKTPKQCKARWSEWLDPGIRKVEWSKDEDEKLLHLAKLMPTQWRTIAPIVGRTAAQCLERYQKLLDDAEARENDDLGLGGPAGGEASAPNADDVRKLRPGEMDPDPESKPARPDTIDMDEDEKEMLSEARARLANTQGKKAKRKARERQLEESRRLAVLQKRRELKNAGINIKVVTKKKGQMDYNADIPFEKAPAPGFYDTVEEEVRNEKQREAFDPRKQQLANKRKGDQEDDRDDSKRRKNDKAGNAATAAAVAAAKAGQAQRLREAEQSSRRRGLVLPAPQVGESELEEIVKMGLAGERANLAAGGSDNDATRALIGNYSDMVAATPIRTPRAPQEEDRIANEIRNARARTETQSALLGGENTDMIEGDSTTGYGGVAPTKHTSATPNPMATPFRNSMGATPGRVGATPLRTPRDSYALNQDNAMQLVGQTPRDLRLREQAMRGDLRSKLSSLPKPKESEWELELPDEQEETAPGAETSEEDAAIIDARMNEARDAAARAELKRQSQVVQRGLPRPTVVDLDAMLKNAADVQDVTKRSIEREMALIIANDARKFGRAKVKGKTEPFETFEDNAMQRARLEIALEVGREEQGRKILEDQFRQAWDKAHEQAMLPGLAGYAEDEIDEHQLLTEAFDNIQDSTISTAEKGNALEKKLAKHHGGYMARSKTLRQKISEAADFLARTTIEMDTTRTALQAEDAGITDRLEKLREEIGLVSRREREAQEEYRARRYELDALVA